MVDQSDAMEFFMERAAIIEIDGCRNRPDASYAAEFLTRRYCDRHGIDYLETPGFTPMMWGRIEWSDELGKPVRKKEPLQTRGRPS
jgi:hypothetical protein